MSEDFTPEQEAAAERAMAGMEAQADIWAEEVNLTSMIKNVAQVARLKPTMPTKIREQFIARMEAQFDAIARQCFLEGWMRGGMSRQDYDAARAADTLASKDTALAEIRAELAEFDETNRQMVKHADLRRAELAEIRAENERWCDAAQATSAKLTAANAELARVRKAIEAGKLLANAAFNIHQMGATDANSLRSLKEAQVAWDDALLASLAERAA